MDPKKRLNPRKPKFEIYQDAQKEYRWRFKAKNGEIVASGEGYKNLIDCLHGVELLRSEAAEAKVIDLPGIEMLRPPG